jgi:hypothetical protein
MYRPLAFAALLVVACDGGNKLSEPIQEPSAAPNSLIPRITPSIKRIDGATASVIGPAPHNPRSQVGMEVICFDGTTDGGFNGRCNRMQPTKDGAELNTYDGDDNPNNSYAGFYAYPQTVRGKLLGAVQELRYSYAGGNPSGGSPRWSVAIDEDGDSRHEEGEAYAFADALACNDGDANVGTSDAEDDPTCTWFYEAESFPNWDAFAGAHPGYKVALRRADGSPLVGAVFVIIDQPGHYVMWNVQAN